MLMAMKFIKYKKYVPEPASEMSMEDLLNALSDYLLQSGFQQQYTDWYDLNDAEQTLDELRQAIADALMNSDMLDEQMREQIENMSGEQLEQLIEQLIERMEQENYISDRSAARSLAAVDRRRPGRRRAVAGALRDHRQGPRLPRLHARCAICWARWANPALAGTTRATRLPASKPAAPRRPTNSATRSTSTSRRRSPTPFSAKACTCR